MAPTPLRLLIILSLLWPSVPAPAQPALPPTSVFEAEAFQMRLAAFRQPGQGVWPRIVALFRRLPSTPEPRPVTRFSDVRKTPAFAFLEALGLSEAVQLPPEELERLSAGGELPRRRLSMPSYETPSGLFQLLRQELWKASAFDLVYSADGYLIGIFPVLDADSLDQGRPHFFDLTAYYLEVPRPGDPGAADRWDVASAARRRDTLQLERYQASVRWPLDAQASHIEYYVAEVDTADGTVTLQSVTSTSPNPFADSRPARQGSRHRVVVPVLPTVFVPPPALSTDRTYHRSLLGFGPDGPISAPQAGDDVWVVGPGSGIDTWLVALRTGRPVHVSGINPFEIANVKLFAQLAGFEVETRVFDNLADLQGHAAFADRRFDWVVWNMPHLSPVVEVRRLADRHDGDPEGLILQRFSWFLPAVLKEGGRARIWNSGDENVNVLLRMIRDAGVVPETHYLSGNDGVYTLKPEAYGPAPTRLGKKFLPYWPVIVALIGASAIAAMNFYEPALTAGLWRQLHGPLGAIVGFVTFRSFVNATSDKHLKMGFSGIRADMAAPDDDGQINTTYLLALSMWAQEYARNRLRGAPAERPLRLGVARDARPSGAAIRDALARGYQLAADELGRSIEIVDLGVVTTPIAESAVRSLRLDGSAIITASHNPLKQNGVKFTGSFELQVNDPAPGSLLAAVTMKDLLTRFEAYRQNESAFVALQEKLEATTVRSLRRAESDELAFIFDAYVREIVALFPKTPLPDILKGYVTAVDTNGGAGSARLWTGMIKGVIASVLEAVGLKVLDVNGDVGEPKHDIEPKGKALELLREILRNHGIDFGGVYDFDADRNTLVARDGTEEDIDEQTVAAFNVAMRLAWMEAYNIAPTGPVVIVAHEATSKRVEEIAALFSRPDRPVTVRRVETGEINVVTAMRQERAKGHYVPIGVEGANGGTVLGEATCRDGIATQILTALAIRDPKIRAAWAHAGRRADLDPTVNDTPVTLLRLTESLPRRWTPQRKLEGVPVPVPALKVAMETDFQGRWISEPWLQETYKNYRFEHYEETQTRDHLFDEGLGGWLLVLERWDGREEFLWLRPSRTETGIVRASVDALSDASAFHLQNLWDDLYGASVRQLGQPMTPALFDRLVRTAGSAARIDFQTGTQQRVFVEAMAVGAPRTAGSPRNDFNVLIRLPRRVMADEIALMRFRDLFLSRLTELMRGFPRPAPTADVEVHLQLDALDSGETWTERLTRLLEEPQPSEAAANSAYLLLEYYVGDLETWRTLVNLVNDRATHPDAAVSVESLLKFIREERRPLLREWLASARPLPRLRLPLAALEAFAHSRAPAQALFSSKPLPPLSYEEALASVRSRLSITREEVVVMREALERRALSADQRSLHLGSKRSLLPIIEAMMGLHVTAIDIDKAEVDRFLRDLYQSGLLHELRRRGGSFQYLVADVLGGNLPAGPWDHVTAIDFVPEDSGTMATALNLGRVDLYRLGESRQYQLFRKAILPALADAQTLLIGVQASEHRRFFDELQRAIAFLEVPTDFGRRGAFAEGWPFEPLKLLRILPPLPDEPAAARRRRDAAA